MRYDDDIEGFSVSAVNSVAIFDSCSCVQGPPAVLGVMLSSKSVVADDERRGGTRTSRLMPRNKAA